MWGELIDLVMMLSPLYLILASIVIEREDDLESLKDRDEFREALDKVWRLSIIDLAVNRFGGDCAAEVKKLIYYTVQRGLGHSITSEFIEKILEMLESTSSDTRRKGLEALRTIARIVSDKEVAGLMALRVGMWLERAVKSGGLDDSTKAEVVASLGTLAYRSISKSVSHLIIEWFVEGVLLNPNYSKVYFDEESFA